MLRRGEHRRHPAELSPQFAERNRRGLARTIKPRRRRDVSLPRGHRLALEVLRAIELAECGYSGFDFGSKVSLRAVPGDVYRAIDDSQMGRFGLSATGRHIGLSRTSICKCENF